MFHASCVLTKTIAYGHVIVELNELTFALYEITDKINENYCFFTIRRSNVISIPGLKSNINFNIISVHPYMILPWP